METIKVTACSNCPHGNTELSYQDELIWCEHTDVENKGPIEWGDKPPKWCPLRNPQYENLNFLVKRDSRDRLLSKVRVIAKFK